MIEDKGIHRYHDIINLPHHTSKTHPRMSPYDRAAQFSPFAALTGYDTAIRETSRLTDRKIELDEDTKERLNEKLQMIQENFHSATEVTITYFQPDRKKAGGAYVNYTGVVKRIDPYERLLVMTDKTLISLEQIIEIEIH